VSETGTPTITGWLWWAGRIVLTPLFRIVFRIRVTGLEHVPHEGPVLLTCNHISMWDPPMIGYAVCRRRRIYFMAKRELMELPVAGWVFAHAGAFGVDRGAADRRAIRTARDLLADGKALLMFPEGTRYPSGQLGEAWPGAGALAGVAGTTVIPVSIVGSNRRFGPVRVAIGLPLEVGDIVDGPKSARSQAIADRMMAAIRELRDTQAGGGNG
jgi:1-acyl-sn-glycerol-3-phosphate acyltransferase